MHRLDLYLRIATELYLKRCIIGGIDKVYELGKDFRNEGVSYKHNPEFTMLEWYEAYTDYRDQMERVEQLIERVARETTGGTNVTYRGHEVELWSLRGAPDWFDLRVPVRTFESYGPLEAELEPVEALLEATSGTVRA